MKDYYRILRVTRGAEQQEITASYRRLIRTCHPDALSPEQRDDPAILRKAQELNEAYEILGNAENRLVYDLLVALQEEQEKAAQPQRMEHEERIYLVRCSETGGTFRAYLARPANSSGPFKVEQLEPLDALVQIEAGGTKSEISLRKILGSMVANGKRKSKYLKLSGSAHESSHLTKEIEQILSQSTTLTMGDIDWNDLLCPDCGSIIKNPNGTLATWMGCSKCGHLYCVGGVRKILRGQYSKCPWCGRTKRATRSVPLGSKDPLALRGAMKQRPTIERVKDNPSRPRDQDKRELGNGGREPLGPKEL